MDRELFEAARAVRLRAYAPYSKFLVGAALRTEGGLVHAGCNVENAAFPQGCCAEASAIAVMISASTGERDRRIASMCIVAEGADGKPAMPCGGCRQRIAEFADPATQVHVADLRGQSEAFGVDELLPLAFRLE